MTALTPAPRRARRVRHTTALAAGTITLLTLGVGIATAHDPLAATNAYVPANGATVQGGLPAQILVNFQNTFRQAGSDTDSSVAPAHVLDTSGADHVASAVQNPANAKQLIITTDNRSVTGPYTVAWTITASDGDVVSNDGSDTAEEGGPLKFTVATASTTSAPTATAATTSSSSSSDTGTVIAAVVGVGIVVLVGVGAIFFWSRRRRDEFDQER